MPRADQSARPVQTLRDAIQAFEAALLLCLAKPRKKAVHKIRTATRRIEAQLYLLAMLADLPPHQKQARKAIRLLKKIRRAAGHVRDLDVQRDLIRSETQSMERPERNRQDDLRREARALRRKGKQQRAHLAEHLVGLIDKHRADIPTTFEKLLDALARAESFALSEPKLTSLVRTWFKQQSESTPAPRDAAKAHDTLHAIRRHAKLARYIAESGPDATVDARRLAARFEQLQQAGDEWHDWLLLHKLSVAELGKSARLSQLFAAHADASLRGYQPRLAKLQERSASHRTRPKA